MRLLINNGNNSEEVCKGSHNGTSLSWVFCCFGTNSSPSSLQEVCCSEQKQGFSSLSCQISNPTELPSFVTYYQRSFFIIWNHNGFHIFWVPLWKLLQCHSIMAQHCTKKIQVIRHSAASSRSFAFEKKNAPKRSLFGDVLVVWLFFCQSTLLLCWKILEIRVKCKQLYLLTFERIRKMWRMSMGLDNWGCNGQLSGVVWIVELSKIFKGSTCQIIFLGLEKEKHRKLLRVTDI